MSSSIESISNDLDDNDFDIDLLEFGLDEVAVAKEEKVNNTELVEYFESKNAGKRRRGSVTDTKL